MADCDDRQLAEAQRVAGYQNQRTGVPQALRPFTGRPTLDNLLDYINRELVPAVRRTRSAVNDIYLPAVENAPSANPLIYYFSTDTTNADPTTGRLRLDASPQNTATTIRISETNARLVDALPWLEVMAGGSTSPLGVVTLSDAINPGRFLRFDLNSMTDQGAYWDLGVGVIESSHDDPFVDGGGLVVSFIPGVASGGTTVPPGSLTPIGANTVIGNPTTSTAAPTEIAIAENSVLGRAGITGTGNIEAITVPGTGTLTGETVFLQSSSLRNHVRWHNWNLTAMPLMLDNRFVGNLSGATARPQYLGFDELNSNTITYENVGKSFIREALTGDVTAPQNSNATTITDGVVTNAKLANMAAGRVKGVQIDGSTGPPQDLTGAEVTENLRRDTVQTVSGVSGTLDIQLNDDTTVLLIRTTGDATLRTLESSTIADGGREVVIEHDRLSGSGILTIAHNTAGTYSRFFNPGTTNLYLGQTQCCTVRLRSGFWRPQATMNGSAPFRFPGAPIYDVMAPPFNAVGNGVADDTAAINAAIAAANANPGDIYLGPEHLISGALTAITGDAIWIHGRGSRGDGTLITATGATPYNVFTFDTCRDSGISDVFIEGPGTWASRGLGIFIDDAFRTRVERCEIRETYGAIEIYASVITEIVDTYAASIYGDYAFYAYGSAADGENHALRFIGCATGSDVTSGAITWYKQGSGSHTFELINCGALHGGKGLHVCDDTPYGSDSTPRFTRTLNFQCEDAEIHAIHLEAGATASFTHTLLLSCLGNAFQVDSTYSGNWEVNGGMIHGADGHGMSIAGDHWSVTGMQIGNIDPGQDCINIGSGSGDFSITGCSLGDIFGTNSGARYGINIDATCVRYTIADNRIIGNDTGAINDGPGAATSRVIQGNNPTSVNTVRIDEIEPMAVGTVIGRRIDHGSTGRPVALTGAEQAENWRRATIQTVSGVSGTLDILLNDDTTVLLIRTTGDATLRTLGDGLATAGREVVIEHDRLSGSGNLTIAHNTAGTYSSFFNPSTSNIVLGQTTCCTVRLRSGFWRPQGGAAGISAIADDTFLANISGAVAPPSAVALTTLAGAGLTGGADAILAVGAGTGITVNTNDVAVTIPLTDGDKGHIVVASSGTVWTWDTTVAITGAQVISTTADLTLTVGEDFFVTAQNDVVINAGDTAGGVAIHAGLTPKTGANDNRVTITADDQVVLEPTGSLRLFTNGTERLEIENDGAWQLAGNTGTSGQVLTSGGASAGPSWTTIVGLTDGDKGDITVSSSGATWTIDNDVVTDGKLRNSAALSVIGRSANSTGDPADIAAGTDGHVLRRSGTTLGFGTIATGGITDAAVTLAKMANLAQSRIIGRAEGAGTGVPTALTPTQVVSIIDGEAVTWTGAHSFTGASHTVNVSGTISETSGSTANYTAGTELILSAGTRVSANSPFSVASSLSVGTVSSSSATALDNFSVGSAGVARFTGPPDPLTGIVPAASGQVLLLVNAHASSNMVINLESANSSAANRFAGTGTSRVIRPREMALAWYDDAASRWRLLCRDEIDL